MSRKSAHCSSTPQNAGPPSQPLTAPQVEFARMLGAVLAATWLSEPSRALPPALQPNAPSPEPKKLSDFPRAPLTGFPG